MLGALPPRPSVPGVEQSGPVAHVRRARVWGPGAVPLAPVPCGGLCTAAEGLPSVTAHRCGGRLASGAFPLFGGGQAPLPVCTARGAWVRGPCTGPLAPPGRPPRGYRALWPGAVVLLWLRYPSPGGAAVGVRCPLGLVGGQPRGVASRRCEGHLVLGALPLLAARH